MRAAFIRIVVAVCCLFSLTNCGTIPALEETTGGAAPPTVFIRDVVQRVKCEIYDTAQSLHANPKMAWTRNWEAKVNLSLSVTNTAGLTPSVQAVKFLPNAYYNATSSTGAPLLAAVQQKFTFGANLTLSESATRTELVVFTVAFGDIVAKGSSEQPKDCRFFGRELRGGLGLQEWIDSSFSTVEGGQLLAGKLPKLKTDEVGSIEQNLCSDIINIAQEQNPAGLPQNVIDRCSRVIALSPVGISLDTFWNAISTVNDRCVYEAFINFVNAQKIAAHGALIDTSSVKKAQRNIHDINSSCKDLDELSKRVKLREKMKNAFDTMSKGPEKVPQHYKDNIEPFKEILQMGKIDADIRSALQQLESTPELIENYKDLSEKMVVRYDTHSEQTEKCEPNENDPQAPLKIIICNSKYNIFIYTLAAVSSLKSTADSYQKLKDYITGFSPTKPLDSLTHTVTFIVTYGGGIQPNWTLMQVAGPLTQLASAQGVRTHTLIISVGPGEENKTNIQNQTVTNTKPQ